MSATEQTQETKAQGGKGPHKLLEITISGNYRTAGKDIIDFENVTGTIPYVDEDIAKMHVMSRYAARWVKSTKDDDGKALYPERIDGEVRQIHIDDIKTTRGTLSFVGKDIKEMTDDELQDLATAKDLRLIPLPRQQSGSDMREMREKAYKDYQEKVLGVGKSIDPNKPDFNFAKCEPLKVESANARRDARGRVTNEEIIEREQASTSTAAPKHQLSLKELKEIADSKNIVYDPSASYNDLYTKIFQA